MLPLLRDIPGQNQKHNFLLGVDHYYSLNAGMGMCMTPEKAVNYQLSLDMLENMGMPPSVLEMQSGSASAYPPILPENLLGFYMTHFALGMKGVNYYIFTGGPNFENTGTNVQIYDYHAPISADGTIKPIYYAQKQHNEFMRENRWMLTADRVCDVQLGYYWEQTLESLGSPCKRYSRDELNLYTYRASLLLAMGLSSKLVKNVEIGAELDVTKPLMVVCDQRMPKEKQENLVQFVKDGGRLILTPVVPEYDEDFYPCTVLKDFLGVEATKAVLDKGPVILKTGERVYELGKRFAFPGFGGTVLGTNEFDGSEVIAHKAIGNGAVILMGLVFSYGQFCQVDMLNLCLALLDYQPVVTTDCPHLMTTLWNDGSNTMCFLINNLAARVTATVQVTYQGKRCVVRDVEVPAQSVIPLLLDMA
jgi:beta-galactosidase